MKKKYCGVYIYVFITAWDHVSDISDTYGGITYPTKRGLYKLGTRVWGAAATKSGWCKTKEINVIHDILFEQNTKKKMPGPRRLHTYLLFRLLIKNNIYIFTCFKKKKLNLRKGIVLHDSEIFGSTNVRKFAALSIFLLQ